MHPTGMHSCYLPQLCLSVHGGGGGVHGRGHAWWGGVCGRGVCMAWEGGMHGMHAPQQILWDTVNERAVCILLECILVTSHNKVCLSMGGVHGIFACMVGGGVCGRGMCMAWEGGMHGMHAPQQILWDTVNERASYWNAFLLPATTLSVHGGLHGRGHAWWGVCVAGVCVWHGRGHAWHACPPADTMRYS